MVAKAHLCEIVFQLELIANGSASTFLSRTCQASMTRINDECWLSLSSTSTSSAVLSGVFVLSKISRKFLVMCTVPVELTAELHSFTDQGGTEGVYSAK